MANLLLKWLPVFAFILILSVPQALAAADPKGSSAAQTITAGLTATNQTAGFATDALPVVTGKIIQAVLGIVGLLFLVLTVYAGVLYMTAQGDTTKVATARKIIGGSVIGILIIVGAYTLTKFVVDEISQVSNPAPPDS